MEAHFLLPVASDDVGASEGASVRARFVARPSASEPSVFERSSHWQQLRAQAIYRHRLAEHSLSRCPSQRPLAETVVEAGKGGEQADICRSMLQCEV